MYVVRISNQHKILNPKTHREWVLSKRTTADVRNVFSLMLTDGVKLRCTGVKPLTRKQLGLWKSERLWKSNCFLSYRKDYICCSNCNLKKTNTQKSLGDMINSSNFLMTQTFLQDSKCWNLFQHVGLKPFSCTICCRCEETDSNRKGKRAKCHVILGNRTEGESQEAAYQDT